MQLFAETFHFEIQHVDVSQNICRKVNNILLCYLRFFSFDVEAFQLVSHTHTFFYSLLTLFLACLVAEQQ